MTKINIITTPDVIHNQSLSFLLVQPSIDVRDQFQHLLEKFDQPLNIYLYDPQREEERTYSWLLNVTKFVDYTILDIDNLDSIERNLASYIVSLPNTFYLTKDEFTPYNILSVNRIYNLDWLYDKLKED
tara:strand:+ start:14086 stop:14472 length:387 start_codon:yes stop_codon:yes gene_type:complete